MMRKQRDRGATERAAERLDRIRRAVARRMHAIGQERGDLADHCKQPGVALYAAASIRILVVNPTRNQAAILDLSRNRERQLRRARIARAAQAQRLRDLWA
jgi:hypothetical protein